MQAQDKSGVEEAPRKRQQGNDASTTQRGAPSHEFANHRLRANEIRAIQWSSQHEKAPEKVVAEYAYEMGIDPDLTAKMLELCQQDGILDEARRLTAGGESMTRREHETKIFGGHKWCVQCPDFFVNSNMHWISPASRAAHDKFLRVLSEGGFDKTLQAIGTHLGVDQLTVHQLTLLCISKCEKGEIHVDSERTGGKVVNLLLPLQLPKEITEPELNIADDHVYKDEKGDDVIDIGSYKYDQNTAVLFGDNAKHATAEVDYTPSGEFRFMASVLIGEVNKDNIWEVEKNFAENSYRPTKKKMLDTSLSHWNKDDSTVRLPTK